MIKRKSYLPAPFCMNCYHTLKIILARSNLIKTNQAQIKRTHQSVLLRTAARTGDFISPAFCSVKDLVQAVSIAPCRTNIIKPHQQNLKVTYPVAKIYLAKKSLFTLVGSLIYVTSNNINKLAQTFMPN